MLSASTILVAYLYVETGVFLILPVFLLLLRERAGGAKRFRRAWIAAGLGFALVVGAYFQQFISGKGSVPMSWVTQGFFNYNNAFPPPEPSFRCRLISSDFTTPLRSRVRALMRNSFFGSSVAYGTCVARPMSMGGL